MGVRLRAVFLRWMVLLVIGGSLIVALNLGLYLYGVNTGWIDPLNRISTEVEQAKAHLASAPQVTEDQIPLHSNYALFTPAGEYIRGSIDPADASALWNQTTEQQQSGSNPYLYSVINRDGEVLVLSYPTTAQFRHPALQKLIPSVDLFLIVLILLQLLALLIVVSYWFGRYVTKRMNQLLVVVQKVENQDLDFTLPKTKLFEIDQVLDALENMRQALKRSLTAQWRADKMRQDQISALAHDLKTPLTIIRGNAELLQDTPLSEEQVECVEYIKTGSMQVQNYTETLIEATKLWGRYELQFALTRLDTFVDELRTQAKGLCLVQGIELAWSCNLQRSHMNIDASSLMRALINVVSNAVEHTPTGGAVTVSVEEHENHLRVAVMDTGSGFSQEALKRATEQFYTGDSSRGSKSHFGIGLFVADSICEKHGGQLSLANNPDGGAKVTLTIPFQ